MFLLQQLYLHHRFSLVGGSTCSSYTGRSRMSDSNRCLLSGYHAVNSSTILQLLIISVAFVPVTNEEL